MGRLALVFPGQGSQSVGMMAPYEPLPAVRSTFDEASAVLEQDLWALASAGPAEELNRTVNTQPLMLTADIALLRAWREAGGPQPDFVAGHSLGEYGALVAAGVLTFRDALPLVRFRAQIMQEAVPEGTGGIAAILGLDDEAIRAVCTEAAQGDVLEPANYNAPGQVVIAGARAAVERGMELAKSRGAKRAVMLAMSAPSHCSLMRPAAERLRPRLEALALQPPAVTLLHNADAKAAATPAELRASMIRQVHSPVRWVEIVRSFAEQGVTRIVECGPGGVLTALNKRIAPQAEAVAIKDAAQLLQLAGAGRMSEAGTS
jgi:[acyl-carrier-protein] S-malonyltransferase